MRRAGVEMGDLKDANARVAAAMAARASARAPRRTGRLAGTVRGNRALRKAVVSVGFASVPYAGPIHWGWPRRGIEPNPFVWDAMNESEPVWLPMYAADVQQLLDRVRGIY